MHEKFLRLHKAHFSGVRNLIKYALESKGQYPDSVVEQISLQVWKEVWEQIAKFSIAENAGILVCQIAIDKVKKWEK